MSLELPPAAGRILAVYARPLARVQMSVLPTVETGEPIALTVRVLTEADERAPGVQPLEITVETERGDKRVLRRATEDGICRLRLPVSDVAEPGEWTITATDLTTGHAAEKTVRIKQRSARTKIGWEGAGTRK